MMASAYDEWAGEKRNANEAILREIGLDPVTLAGMSHQEIRAQLKTIEADPVQSARLPQVMLDHHHHPGPGLRPHSEGLFPRTNHSTSGSAEMLSG